MRDTLAFYKSAATFFVAASSAAAIFIQCVVIASQCCLANSEDAATANCLHSAAVCRNSSSFWYWTLHAPGGLENLPPSNHVATLEAAKAEFETAWKRWKAWAKMEEMP
jgi:hypothetical protein